MADDISATLEQIAKQSASVTELTKALGQLEEAKKSALKAGDTKGLLNLVALERATNKLRLAETARLKLQKDMIEQAEAGLEVSEDTLKAIKANDAAIKKSQEIILSAAKSQTDAHALAKKQAIELKEAALQNFREHTKLGKAFTLANTGIVKFAGGLTFASLAMKAYSRYTEAAEVRQKILIQGFRGFGAPLTSASKDLSATGKAILGTGESLSSFFGSSLPASMGKSVVSFIDTHKEVLSFNEAIANAESTAYRMGVSIDVVSGAMVDFARITGKSNPEALGKLTEGAIAVSRAIGITVPEAVDFVSTRMDKFGGTAASALIGLNELRVESERINSTFGRTIIRGDDLAKTLQQISSQTTIYAIDQRLVGSILRDNIARIQATGESYDNARKKAEAFTAGLTTQAPEWMQVLAGEDLAGNMAVTFGDGGEAGAKAFQEQFGDSLDAAKPGLSKRVQGILKEIKSGDRNSYEGMRLIQELTQGTSVGIEAMNKQLLNLSRATGASTETIAKQMGVSRDVADGMVKAAEAMETQQKQVAALAKLPTDQLADQLGISKALAEVMAGSKLTDQERTKNLKEFLKLKNEQKMKAVEQKRLDAEAVAAQVRRVKIEKEMKVYTEERAKLVGQMGKGGDDAGLKIQIDSIDEVVKSKQAELSQMVSEAASRQSAAAELNVQMGQVGSITQGLKDQFAGYASASGNYFKELFAKLGTIPVLLGSAVAAGIWMKFKVFGRMEEQLAKIHAAILAKGVGGGGDGGGSIDTDGGKAGEAAKTGEKVKKAGVLSRMKNLFKKGGKGALGGVKGAAGLVAKGAKGLAGSAAGLVGKAANLVRSGAPLKLLKGVPLVGTLVGAAVAIPQALKLWEKYKKGEPISPSDKIKMLTTLGSMIPGIGTAVMMADMAADHTGVYDAIDEALKSKVPVPDLKAAENATDVPPEILTAEDKAKAEADAKDKPPETPEQAKASKANRDAILAEADRGAPVYGGRKAAKTPAFDTSPVREQAAAPSNAAGLVMAAANAASLAANAHATPAKLMTEPAVPMPGAATTTPGTMMASTTMPPPAPVPMETETQTVAAMPTKWQEPVYQPQAPQQASTELRARDIDNASQQAHADAVRSYEALARVVENTGKLLTLLPDAKPLPQKPSLDMSKLAKSTAPAPVSVSTISQVDFNKMMQPKTAAQASTNLASAKDQAAEASAAAPAESAATGPLPAEFGALQSDGSILLKVTNFMPAFAQAQVMSKGRIRTSG